LDHSTEIILARPYKVACFDLLFEQNIRKRISTRESQPESLSFGSAPRGQDHPGKVFLKGTLWGVNGALQYISHFFRNGFQGKATFYTVFVCKFPQSINCGTSQIPFLPDLKRLKPLK